MHFLLYLHYQDHNAKNKIDLFFFGVILPSWINFAEFFFLLKVKPFFCSINQRGGYSWHFRPFMIRTSTKRDFFKKKSSIESFSTETIMTELEHVVVEKTEFQHSTTSEIKITNFLKDMVTKKEKQIWKKNGNRVENL